MKTSLSSFISLPRLFFSFAVLATLVCIPLVAAATEEVYYGGLHRQQVTTGAFFEVADTFPAAVDQTLSVKNIIWFSIDEDTLIKSTTFTHWVDVKIEKYNASNMPIGVDSVRFIVNYDPNEGVTYKYGDVYEFTNAYRFKVTITGTSSSFPVFMRLEGKIIIDRKYAFDCATSPVLLTKTHAELMNTTTNSLRVGWQKQAGAEEYDLEWTLYDTLSPTITLASGSHDNFDFLFRNNATRITTGQTWYDIPLIYPKGRIYWRVRGARSKNNVREMSIWTSLKASPDYLIRGKEWYWVNAHEQGLNWQMQTIFAEEGKKSQSATYFDGSLRNRQKVVRSEAIGMTIASETIYDSLGRAAIQVMPAPVSSDTGVNDWTRKIQYNASYSAALGKTYYAAADFTPGSSSFDCNTSYLNPVAIMDTLSSAVGRYYSSNNPWKNRFMSKFTPASEGYPFSVTEYMPDQTGRVRRQGGVGPVFQLGSNHETKYYYAKPEQVELDRLFGNEAGIASHYQKNAVKDANGQISVSYIDAHGRTVATALAGTRPSNLEQLSNFSATASLKRDLLNNLREGTALVSTYTLFKTNAGGDTITYSHLSNEFSIEDCLLATRCYDCKYDLEIKVMDECGAVLAGHYISNYTISEEDTLCAEYSLPGEGWSAVLSLPVGQYQITKILKINETALNAYADDYLKHLICVPSIQTLQNNILGDTSCNKTCQECYTRLGTLPEFQERYFQGFDTIPSHEDSTNSISIYNRAKLQCSDLCDNGDPSDCGIMYEMMLTDVMPGGQYAEYGINTIGPGPDSTSVFTASTDKTSVFYPTGGVYPFQEVVDLEGGTNFYRDEFGQIDYITRPDSTKTRIDSLTLNEFITYFKPSWAKTLVKAHPEYCSYLCCKENSNTAWDSLFSTVTTYAQAVDSNFWPLDSLLAHDPFFANDSTLKASMLITWNSYTTTAPGPCSSPISLVEILTSIIYCGGTLPCDATPGECTADNDMFWKIFQSHYLSEKSRLKWSKIRSGACAAPTPANTFCKNATELCFGKATCDTINPNPYENKMSRIFPQSIHLSGEAVEDSLYSLLDTVKVQLGAVCDTTCAAMADQWILKLSATCTAIAEADPDSLIVLRNRFIAVCKSGCDLDHPYGSVTTNGTATSYDDQDLQEIINEMFFSGEDSSCSLTCSAQLIDFPGTYTVKQYLAPPQQVTTNDSCVCARITALNACWEGKLSLLDFINASSDVKITKDQLYKLEEGCSSKCTFLDEVIQIPPILECNTCKTLNQVKREWEGFIGSCIDTATLAKKNFVASHLNQYFGLNRSYDDYYAFVVTGPQDNFDCRFLCPLSRFPEAKIDTSCISMELQEGTFTMANLSYQNLLDSMRRVFVRQYLTKCLNTDSLNEQFEDRSSINEYHYTLYYYDQAGNLVRTVPPKGVVPLTNSLDLDSVRYHRLNPVSPPQYPAHTFISRYWYNTINQLVRDSTPDRNDSDYWYDKLGRLVLLQNAKQRPQKDYTYSRYDFLGRVIETGRIRKDSTGLATLGTIWDYATFETWLTLGLVGNYEVTQTYYDDVISSSFTNLPPYFPNPDGTSGQTNLRNRVASVTYEETKDNDPLTYDNATHYSYDISGNVKQMVQDIPELDITLPTPSNHRYKRIGYEYDLVSGKVNYVFYQKDSIDQFIHHYVYDADNRIQFVETSQDSLIWERDANYEYYLHGPLGRTELGERRVQGLDYAYTLQGWLKGVNASALSLEAPNTADFDTRDMGRDGKSGNVNDFARTKNVARDVAAFTLGYYYGDYRKVGITSSDNFEMAVTSASYFNNASPGLYNGNIRHAVYSIAHLNETGSGASAISNPEGYAYKYDQLNRLVSMRAHVNDTLNPYEWSSAVATISNNFRENASYDPNGNILTYLRRGNKSTQYTMDNLNYNYPSNTNKLTHIDDAQTNTSAYANDLEDQNTGNYTYDAVGNLTKDTKENLLNIQWTNSQKLKSYIKYETSYYYKYNSMQQRLVKSKRILIDTTHPEERTYYIRDAQGNVMATYKAWLKDSAGLRWDSLRLAEHHIYGSSRVGMTLDNVELLPTIPQNPHLPDTAHYPIFEGWKRYEITNHLGNVMAVITDRKRGAAASGTDIEWFDADVVSSQQYYPFGMLMPGHATASLRRQYTLGSNDYRYGFNGKEGDDEVKGDDNQQDYGMRIYDPRVGRFLSVDPIAREYPWNSTYAFAENDVIRSIDLDGQERYFVINNFDANGNPSSMTLQTLTDNQLRSIVDILATADNSGMASVNGTPITSGQRFPFNVFIINQGAVLPQGTQPIEGRNTLTNDEQTLINQGTPRNLQFFQRTSTNIGGYDNTGYSKSQGFDFPGSDPDNNFSSLTHTQYQGQYIQQTVQSPATITQPSPVARTISANFGFLMPVNAQVQLQDINPRTGMTRNTGQILASVASNVRSMRASGTISSISVNVSGNAGTNPNMIRAQNFLNAVFVPQLIRVSGLTANNINVRWNANANNIILNGTINTQVQTTTTTTTRTFQPN